MIDVIKQSWPWWITGPLIGLAVPVLLLLGNKSFGVSSNLRHICAACFPGNVPFFRYDWKKEAWNLFFAAGTLIGGFIGWQILSDHVITISQPLLAELNNYGIHDHNQLVPSELVNWSSLFSVKGVIMIIAGGFLIGFGTRYADGCTSGHAIAGLSNLQWPSLVATCSFMVGGLVIANFVLPWILKL